MNEDGHYHKWFLFQVKADFEPTKLKTTDGVKLYKRVEYGYMACNCGQALKTKVKNGDKPQTD